MIRSMLCIAALLCALAAPSAALAQGAGDEQYQDPFGDEQSQQADPTPEPTATPAPAQSTPSAPSAPAPTATPSAAQAPTQAAAPSNQLPRTGVEAGWIALAGALSLAAGLALRRRADLQR
jgi:LPXTG-motif cell wall-anchored protein